jgi:hypothetical protein
MVKLNVEFTSWDNGVCWRSHILNKSIEHPYYDETGLSLRAFLTQETGPAWAKSVPPKQLSALLRFEDKYKELSLSCLWFVSRSTFAQELLLSSPFLTWLIVNRAVDKKLTPEDVFPLFSSKRAELLSLDGLPAEAKLVRFFEKLDEQGVAVKYYQQIKKIIIEHGSDDICRFQVINSQVLHLLESSPQLLKYPFFQNLSSQHNVKNLLILIGDTKFIGEHLEPELFEYKLIKCKSLQDLKRLHNTYMVRDRGFIESLKTGELFPSPPVSGTKNILYIRFKNELVLEGKEMDHCVASYYSRIIKGNYFVYRILCPQRATVGIYSRSGKLEIDQIRLQGNQIPSQATQQAVLTWLNQS